MKKILLLALPLMVMCAVSCEKDNSPIIQFKDPKFLEALLETTITIEGISTERISTFIDRNADGQISEKEASVVTGLYIGHKGIRNMDEIRYFTALTYLDCSENQLTSLDVSNSPALTELDCYANQLTSLDLSNSPALTDLDCFKNQLTSLDLSNSPALTDLDCFENQLTSLDLSNSPALTDLNCSENQLTSLDVSNSPALTDLDCSENQLTSLDVSNSPALTELSCYANQLTSLDLSKNKKLKLFRPVHWYPTSNPEEVEIRENTKCPLESLTLYVYHSLNSVSMRGLEMAYPNLEITYVE